MHFPKTLFNKIWKIFTDWENNFSSGNREIKWCGSHNTSSIRMIFGVILLCMLKLSSAGKYGIDFPYLRGEEEPTPPPWNPGEIIQTKPIDTYPWVTKSCPRKFCDPAPIFKVLASTPTETSYDLKEVLYPSPSPKYQHFLLHPFRNRICNGSQSVDSKCSYFQEFVIDAGGVGPLRILSIHDGGYDDIYLRMRFAWSGANQQFESGEIDEEADYDDSGDTVALVVGGILLLLIAVGLILFCIQKRRSNALQTQMRCANLPMGDPISHPYPSTQFRPIRTGVPTAPLAANNFGIRNEPEMPRRSPNVPNDDSRHNQMELSVLSKSV